MSAKNQKSAEVVPDPGDPDRKRVLNVLYAVPPPLRILLFPEPSTNMVAVPTGHREDTVGLFPFRRYVTHTYRQHNEAGCHVITNIILTPSHREEKARPIGSFRGPDSQWRELTQPA